MKLKKLDIYGFKSFAKRTTFEFDDSLTVLVGPNGAGKSNVVDALKWVLGERSARKLRGEEMANVIFNGSKGARSRKPLNFADVTLTIDNTDRWLPVEYEEVAIRRRVERDGQSQYFINGDRCRLKDVRRLLMDTGVGANSYCFIQQGQVAELLRASPKERRVVFEEAAGINRFLDQKHEAELKLDHVTANLARVSDIIDELQRRLRSVKYQAGRARTYRRQAERLHRLRLSNGVHMRRRLASELDQQRSLLGRRQQEKRRLVELAAANGSALQTARSELQQAQSELSESRQRLTRMEVRLESLARETELNRRRRDELHNQLDELQARRASLEERLRAVDEEAADAAEKSAAAEEGLREKTAAAEAERQRMDDLRHRQGDAERELEARKPAVFDLFQRESSLKNQLEILDSEKQNLAARIERLVNRRAELGRRIERAGAEQAEVRSRLDALEEERAQLAGRMEGLQRTAARAAERLEALAAREAEARAELSGMLSRRDVLRDLEQHAQGMRSGVKKLLTADLEGLVGLLADLIEVPFEKAKAVAAALGRMEQAVVFDRGADAARALERLTSDGSGRAELIVLEHVRPPACVEPPGACVRLSELVRCDERVAPAVELLLGNTFLVRDAATAASLLARGLPPAARLVAPGGECWGADGVWAGGEPETPSLISRRGELAELDQRIAEAEAAAAELAAQRAAESERLRELNADRDDLGARIERLSRSIGDADAQLQVTSRSVGGLRDEIEICQAEERAVAAEMGQMDERRADLKDECQSARRERAEAERAVQAGQEQLRQMQTRQQAQADKINALAGELAAMRERHGGLQTALERLHAERRRLRDELKGLDGEREANARRATNAEEEIGAAQAETARIEDEKAALTRALDAKSEALEGLRCRITDMSDRAGSLTGEREEAEDALQEMRLKENETRIKMEDMLERVAEDFGVRLTALELEPDRWRESPPFTTRPIRDFMDHTPEPEPARPVASWYAEMESGDDKPPEEDQEPIEEVSPIALEEAVALREAVLAMVEDPATDWGIVREEMARLKAKLDGGGSVNVAAIAELEKLEVRLQFLTDQKEDLDAARRHERQLIRELNKRSRQRFSETFEQVRANFQNLFRKLFGGGSADLVLEQDAEDILEAGIDIVARPPRKEANSINLLSGGEQALTTVALLFAMFQSKPSPFCLLDEVDAPLDDSNVERFLMMVEDFQRDTQFIIITHNKLTMGMGHVLYGLTMSDGVSQKLSVRFEDVENEVRGGQAELARAG